jgi:hypothetical protein
MTTIVSVVEGAGDVDAFPILMRRILHKRIERYDIEVAKPKKAGGKGRLLKDLEKFLEYAARTPDCSAILVLIDADDDCPFKRVPSLVQRASQLNLTKPIAFVYANREYEAWFLASLETTSSIIGLTEYIAPSESEVEEMRGVKEWFTRNMPPGRAYKETSDQAPLSAIIDLRLAHERSRSFRRLCHALEELVRALDIGSGAITPNIMNLDSVDPQA